MFKHLSRTLSVMLIAMASARVDQQSIVLIHIHHVACKLKPQPYR